jgi:uncharacterized protein YjbI with pentapeptide repeats
MADDTRRPEPWNVARSRWRPWQQPFIAIEWLTEWVVYAFDRWAFVKLLNVLGSFSLVVTAVAYYRGAPARQQAQQDAIKAKHYQAWQVINTAQGRGGNGGRLDALKELNVDRVDLTGVDLERAWLPGLSLPMGRLRYANADSAALAGADLRGADLSKAHLSGVRLAGADLRGAVLRGATLVGADLTGADLRFADLSDANLRNAQLSKANFSDALLAAADLRDSEMQDATWDSASLSNADLRGATISHQDVLRGAFVGGANLAGTRFSTLPSVLSKDGLRIHFRRRGAVILSADSAWRNFSSRNSGVATVSHAYASWSVKRDRGVLIDSVFPPRRAAPQR